MSFSLSALFLFLTAVSIDSLTAGLTYGTGRVHIKPPAYFILTGIPAVFVATANRISSRIALLFPSSVLPVLSFILLAFIGLSKLSESLIRRLARKHPSLERNWGCRIKQIHIVFTVYLSPEDANREDLQVLSPKEALLLSLALSLDSVLAGMAFSAGTLSFTSLLLFSALFNLLFFSAGYGFGHLVSTVLHVDLSWLSGLFLLFLAIQALL